jgi:Tfp pilus assembly protein PilN
VLVQPARDERVVWLHRVGDTIDLLLLRGADLLGSRSLPASDAATLAAEVRSSLAMARWRECDAVWLSGDDAGALADPLAALGAPVMAPPYTPRARRRLDELGEGPHGATELAVAVASARGIRPLDLIPAAIKPRRLTRHQWITVGMAAAALLLSLGALLAPGVRERRHLDSINAEIGRVDPELRVVERSLRELENKRRLLATVASLETTAIRPLPVLRELTEVVPGDAWLTMLTFDGKGVELTGQASQASLLIPLLENSPKLERVEFASPVTRGRDREQFRIRAGWERQPTAAPAPPPPRPTPGRAGRPGPPAIGAPGEPAPPPTPPAPPRGERR